MNISSYLNIFHGAPHRLILGPLLFNLSLCDLFVFVEEADIMSYARDYTPYVCSENVDVTVVCSKNVDVTLEKLEEVRKALFEWFSNNFLRVR